MSDAESPEQKPGQEMTAEEKKAMREARKKEQQAAKAAKKARGGRQQMQQAQQATMSDELAAKYCVLPLIRSESISGRQWRKFTDVTPERENDTVLVRARIHNCRVVGKRVFLIARQGLHTLQCFLETSEKPLLKWLGGLTSESVVDITGKVQKATVESCTKKDVELHLEGVQVVSAAAALPFDVDAASKPEPTADELAKGEVVVVGRDTRLNARWLDMRTPASNAIFRMQSRVCQYFRQFLLDNDFTEIHTPKIIGSASEGGANVFKLDYFGNPAFLAQSPQLYKQMSLQGDLDRVFEIGPVFRAEDSNTHRHLCEFVGLDLEMTIKEHYYEVLDMGEALFQYIFKNLNNHPDELAAVRAQYPFEDLVAQVPLEKIDEYGMEVIEENTPVDKIRDPGRVRNRELRSFRMSYPDAVKQLNELATRMRAEHPDEASEWPEMAETDDLSTKYEREIGRMVKERYGVDFWILDKYPAEARPFYTMPCPKNPAFTNSYDIFIRGEEISSGAQRIHDAGLLQSRVEAKGIDPAQLAGYLDSMKLGGWPHGGFGVGMERVVMLFLGLHNIRLSSMYPRDPKRCTP